jgi:hypothetical protein
VPAAAPQHAAAAAHAAAAQQHALLQQQALHAHAHALLQQRVAPLPAAPSAFAAACAAAAAAAEPACSSGGTGSIVSHSVATAPPRLSGSAAHAADAESAECTGSGEALGAEGGYCGRYSGGGYAGESEAKRCKRIMANRRSAARSRLRKMQHTIELEASIARLESALGAAQARLERARREAEAMRAGNEALRARAAAMTEAGQAEEWLVRDAQAALQQRLDAGRAATAALAAQQQQQQHAQQQQQRPAQGPLLTALRVQHGAATG